MARAICLGRGLTLVEVDPSPEGKHQELKELDFTHSGNEAS